MPENKIHKNHKFFKSSSTPSKNNFSEQNEEEQIEQIRKSVEADRKRLLWIKNNLSEYWRQIAQSRWAEVARERKEEKEKKETQQQKEEKEKEAAEKTHQKEKEKQKHEDAKGKVTSCERNQKEQRKRKEKSKKETRPDYIAQAILVVLSAASFHQVKEVHVTQKKILENLKLYHGIRICKQTLINRINWLVEHGYIRKKVWVKSWGRNQISKRTTYFLKEKAFALLGGLVKFARKIEKRFKVIRQRVKSWSWKLFGIPDLPKLDVVSWFSELGYKVLKQEG